MKTKPRGVHALLYVLLLGFSLAPVLAESEIFDSLVRIRVDSQSSGVIHRGKYIPQVQVSEVTELQGIIIDSLGHIVSYLGNHWTELMVNNTGLIISVQNSAGQNHSAELLGVDERTALAVLKAKQIRGGPLGVSSELGDDFLDSVSHIEGNWVITGRTVVGVSGQVQPLKSVQIVVSGERTNPQIPEGAFLLNRQGQLSGIVVDSDPHPFSKKIQVWKVVPSNVVSEVVRDIVSQERDIKAGWLGILSHPGPNGVIIDNVVPKSPADQSGLRRNDVIVQLDGQPVNSFANFVQAIRWKGEGRKIELSVRRDGFSRDLSALLTQRPENQLKSFYRLEVPRFWNNEEEPKQGVRLYRTFAPPSLDLGLVVDPLTPQLARYFSCPKGQGLLVRSVQPNSPAHHVGFSAGDVVIRINGQDVSSYAEVEEKLHIGSSGVAFIEFVRDGRIQARKISLP